MISVLSKRDHTSLLQFIAEREAVRQRRASGDPPPWTEDKILGDWSFCNVKRECDRVTCWISDNWREPHADDPDLWFAMAVARLVNWPPSLAEIDWPAPFDRDRFVTKLRERAERCEKVWGDAYTINAGAKGVSKADHIANILEKLWAARDRLRPRPGEGLVEFHNRLKERDGLSDFYAAQIVADVKYAQLLDASDWMTFAASGPGSRRGLNRVMGRDKDAPWKEENWRIELRNLHRAIKPELERLGLGDLHAQDLQNCLCEFDKYERVRGVVGKYSANMIEPRRGVACRATGPCASGSRKIRGIYAIHPVLNTMIPRA